MTTENEVDRRESDRRRTSVSIETAIARGHVALPTAFKWFQSVGSLASTVLLALAGFAYNSVSSEWRELKTAVQEIRHELDKQPSPEEYNKLRDKVAEINERLIRIESRFDE